MPSLSQVYSKLYSANQSGGSTPRQQGVFGLHPTMTPKYALDSGNRDAEYKETLARMFLSLSGANDTAVQAYLDSLPPDPTVRALANVLTGKTTSNQGGTGFIDFLLGQVNEQLSEKVQISEVISDNYVAFFFGQAPPVFTYSGYLLNTVQDDQRIGMAVAYQELLRGTQCARRGALLRLRYDSVIVSGSVLSMSQALNAENETAVPFSLQLLVKEYQIIKKPAFIDVKVDTSFSAGVALGNPGATQDSRVRTSVTVPTQLTGDPIIGPDEGADEPLVSGAQTAAATPNPLLGNVYGTPSASISEGQPAPQVRNFAG